MSQTLRWRHPWILLPFALCTVLAQVAPVVNLRGVVNGVTLQPAPSRVAPGGILWISGLNLGPQEPQTASEAPLPRELGGAEVLINNRLAPIFSASTNRLVVQVPWETNPGLASVVVRRGGETSRTSRITIGATPSVRTINREGWGPVATVRSGSGKITLSASGFSPISPAPASGELLASDSEPQQRVRVYVGGSLAASTLKPSDSNPAEFEIEIALPSKATDGEAISVVSGNQAANRTTLRSAAVPSVHHLPIPPGTPPLTGFTVSDLRPSFVLLNAARDAQGCFQSFRADIVEGLFLAEPGCLTAANNNAPNPFAVALEGNTIAALEGPAQGQAPAGVSNKLRLFNPDLEGSRTVELPGLASNIVGAVEGNMMVRLATEPPSAVVVDSVSTEISPAPLAVGGGGGAGGGQPIGGGANLQVDLGDGLKEILSNPIVAGQSILVVVGDDAAQPKRAKLATLNARLEVTSSRDFPDSWLPLMNPPPARPANLPPNANFQQQPARATVFWDGPAQTAYVLARNADHSQDAVAGFSNNAVRAVESPVFFTNCANPVRSFTFELSRKLVFLGASVADRELRTPCAANSYLIFDLDSRTLSQVALPGNGQLNASAQMGDISDYVWGLNLDPTRPAIADTLYVLDGATASAFRFDLPTGVNGFVNPQPVAGMNSVIAAATNRTAGDEGIVLFELESGASRFFPTPEGFASVQLAGPFSSVRKLVARGIRPNNAGSQILIYDLRNGDLAMPANPPGCMFAGVLPPAVPGGGGGAGGGGGQAFFNSNPRANAITAGCYGENRQLNGLMMVRVP